MYPTRRSLFLNTRRQSALALLSLALGTGCGNRASTSGGSSGIDQAGQAQASMGRLTVTPATATTTAVKPAGSSVATGGPVGFAAVDPGTTGGGAGQVVTVTGIDELTRYLTRQEPLIIQVSGTVTMRGMQHVASNKTIVGLGADAKLVKGGLNLSRVANVIVRNLTFEDSPDDAINLQDGTHHVWIDHNVFGKAHDGQVDVKRESSYVTVSWNIFREHNKTSLVGHDDKHIADKGKLKVTYHHNWFRGESRNPRVRFGEVHVFNNFYDGVRSYGVTSTQDGAVVLEGNFFRGVRQPALVGYEASGPGDLVERENVYESSGKPQTRGSAFEPSSYYAYRLDPASEIPALVQAGAGAGKTATDEGRQRR